MDKNLRSLDLEILECSFNDTAIPFSLKLRDGTAFRIDTEGVLYRKYIRHQLKMGEDITLKFCIGPDEEFESHDESIENWTIYIFPMYIDGDEISHGTVVPYEDSAMNGNIDIQGGRVVSVTSNHNLPEYGEVVNPILEFAQALIEAKLSRYS